MTQKKREFPVQIPFETMSEVDAYFDTEKLVCLMCGKEYISLHVHVRQAHNLSSVDYKAQYGIPWRRGLIANSLKEKQASIMNKQRETGVLPLKPPDSHMEVLRKASRENRKPLQKSVRDNMSRHALHTHGRTARWGEQDFEEFLRRIGSGRTITEVGRDKDMPCREVFDTYKRDNPEFMRKFEETWESLPFQVQARGQKPGTRFKQSIVNLRREGKTWPEIAKILDIKEGTARNTWHTLKLSGKLDQY